MKVLDLFCGRGGWSRPFVDDGDYVIGLDIEDFAGLYPGRFVQGDIAKFHPDPTFDLIIGSSPCIEFSQTKLNYKWHPEGGDIQEGLRLVKEFQRVVEEAGPTFWILENVSTLAWWFPMNPIFQFRMSGFDGRGARRCLWGNLPIPLASRQEWTDIRRSLSKDYGSKQADKRAEIPLLIARFIADSVKAQIVPRINR